MGQLTLTLDLRTLERRSQAALKATAADLDAALRQQFREPHWAWPGQTRRKSGQVAGERRDIVDTGTLMNSQQPPALVSAGHYRILWTADYAAAVFLGAVFKTRTSSLPARNIAFAVFGQLNLAEAYARHWRGL